MLYKFKLLIVRYFDVFFELKLVTFYGKHSIFIIIIQFIMYHKK